MAGIGERAEERTGSMKALPWAGQN